MSDVMQPVALGPELFGEIDKSDVLKSVKTTWTSASGKKYLFLLALVEISETSGGKGVIAYATEDPCEKD